DWSSDVCSSDLLGMEFGDPIVGLVDHILVVTELDRLSRAGLRTGRFLAIDEAVVAERALVRRARIRHVHVRGLAVLAVGGRVDRAVIAAFDDAEGAAGHAGAAAVADIVLDDDGVELGAEERWLRSEEHTSEL